MTNVVFKECTSNMSSHINIHPKRASYSVDEHAEFPVLILEGPLLHSTIGPIWKQCRSAVIKTDSSVLKIDASNVNECDGAGIAMLTQLLSTAEKCHKQAEIVHLKPDFNALLQRYLETPEARETPRTPELRVIASLGKVIFDFFADLYELVCFFGQVLWTFVFLCFHPRRFRWGDFWYNVDQAGVLGIEIVGLLGFLFGLIMAFSSAMPLRQFGVEVYVSDLVAIALVRVLGPFITAIIVAGRTGSAFAAEIGTMKVNNEIDALQVMNLDPVTFLVMPRMLATTLVTPLLAIVANLLGLVGCGLVILSLGYPLVVYMAHVHSILSVTDVLVGMGKAVVFGSLVGMIGCMRGLQTELGAGAVGIATTRAVVTAIITLVLMEGFFSVLLYYLHI